MTGFLEVDGIQMMKYYYSMPVYIVVILVITIFNLDKKMLDKHTKETGVSK